MSYSTLNQNFGFFLNLEKEDSKTITQCMENLIKLYHHNIYYQTKYHLVEEIIQFKGIIYNFNNEKKSSLLNILKSLISTQLHNTFPNIEIH
jgi:hypothetical protein